MSANLFDLRACTAVVLGGTGTLGSAIAHGLCAAGARVAIAGRDTARAHDVVQKLLAVGSERTDPGPGTCARPFAVDITSRTSLETLCADVIRWTGRIHVLVHCAGSNSKTPFYDVTETEWDQIFAVNARSMAVAAQVFAPHMQEHGGGSIIHISSVSSGPPLSGVFAYSASKSAVNSITQYLARELAPSIRVNAIIPGFFPAEQNRKILTPTRIENILRHTPLGRLGEAHELQGAVVWLASEQASGFVTGALIPVDGGFTAMTI
jgi:NAD(P)-dependent dehydrogenase (short-subunit alcohol dehydrogenase family)